MKLSLLPIDDLIAEACVGRECPHYVDELGHRDCRVGSDPEECPRYDAEDHFDTARDNAAYNAIEAADAAVRKYGQHSAASPKLTDSEMLTLLTRELGEVAEECHPPIKQGHKPSLRRQYEELAQLAGVCLNRMAMLDSEGRL